MDTWNATTMIASADVRTAILNQLQKLKIAPSTPVSLFEIGIPLIAAGYDQGEIANALYALDRDRIISLVGANRLEICSLPKELK